MHAAAVVDDVVVVHGERTLTDLDHSRLIRLAGHRLPPVLDDLLAQVVDLEYWQIEEASHA